MITGGNRMKKFLSIIMAMCFILLALAGCTDTNNEKDTSDPTETNGNPVGSEENYRSEPERQRSRYLDGVMPMCFLKIWLKCAADTKPT